MPQDPYASIAVSVDPYADIAVPLRGFQVSNPSTVPNARIRNMPNPAADETSALGALYHGMKTGATLGMIPAAAAAIPTTIPSAIGTATGIVGATALGKGAQAGAEALGAGELGQEAAGDVGSVVGGFLGAGLGEAGANIGKRIYNALPKELQREVLGALIPHARLVRAAAKLLPEEAAVPTAVAVPKPEPAVPAPAPATTPGEMTPQGWNYLGRLQEIARQIEAEEAAARTKGKPITAARAAKMTKAVVPSASTEDLSPVLQEMLKRVMAAKGKLSDLQ